MKKQSALKSAFTLLELALVLALVSVLTAVGFTGFFIMRDSIGASNTAEEIKSIVRDIQDKALTFSTYYDQNNTTSAATDYKDKWVYAYSLEFDHSAQKYKLFTVIDPTNSTPPDPLQGELTNTEKIRELWRDGTDCMQSNNNISSIAKCNEEVTNYVFASKINSASNCDILFTTVNGKITIRGGAQSCYVNINHNFKNLTVSIAGSGVADVKICDGTVTICP